MSIIKAGIPMANRYRTFTLHPQRRAQLFPDRHEIFQDMDPVVNLPTTLYSRAPLAYTSPPLTMWAYSSARLERTPDKREVDGSNPSRPTKITPLQSIVVAK